MVINENSLLRLLLYCFGVNGVSCISNKCNLKQTNKKKNNGI